MDSQGSWKPRRSNRKQYHVFEEEQTINYLGGRRVVLCLLKEIRIWGRNQSQIKKIINKLNLEEDPSEIVKIVKSSKQSKKRNKAKKNVTSNELTQRSRADQTKEIKEAPSVNKNQEKEVKRLWQAIDELRGLFEYEKQKNELTGTQIQGKNCQDSQSPQTKDQRQEDRHVLKNKVNRLQKN